MGPHAKAQRRERLKERPLTPPLVATLDALHAGEAWAVEMFCVSLAEGLAEYLDKIDRLGYRSAAVTPEREPH